MLWLMVVSCGPKPRQEKLPFKPLMSFSFSGTDSLSERWWESFGSYELNALIDSALQRNLDLQGIWQQFLAADATVSREAGIRWPQLDASAQSGISRPKPDFAGGENVQLGVAAGYELDLWGRIGAAIDAERYRAAASLEEYQAARISLVSEVILVWLELTAAEKQLNLIEEQLKTNEDIMALIRNRFGSGQIRAVDILRQNQLLEATRDELKIAETRFRLLENSLSVLMGQVPGDSLTMVKRNFQIYRPCRKRDCPWI